MALFLVIYNTCSTESPAQVLIRLCLWHRSPRTILGPLALFFSLWTLKKMDFGLPWIGTRFQNNQKSNSYQPWFLARFNPGLNYMLCLSWHPFLNVTGRWSGDLPLRRDMSRVQVLLAVGTFAFCCQKVFAAAVGGGSTRHRLSFFTEPS